MNKTIFIIAILFAAIIGGGYFLINSNSQAKSIAEKYGIVDAPAIKPIPVSFNSVFSIIDASGSGKSTYCVPVISVDFIKQLISTTAEKGYGELWLTYIDRSALNNKVLHFSIPEKMKSFEPPVRKAGELKGEYDRRVATFKSDSTKNALQLQEELKIYSESKKIFFKECEQMIALAYAPKKRFEDYSDVIGSLNAALRSLSTVASDSVHFRSILLISDGVQDVPKSNLLQELKEIPSDVQIVTVNNSGSMNSIVAGVSIEVDNLDRGIEKVLRIYKQIKQ